MFLFYDTTTSIILISLQIKHIQINIFPTHFSSLEPFYHSEEKNTVMTASVPPDILIRWLPNASHFMLPLELTFTVMLFRLADLYQHFTTTAIIIFMELSL